MHRGAFVAERYTPGFPRQMRLQGWSMGKSITNALIGILVAQGKLDIHAPAPVPEWSNPTDPRHTITLDQLLRMSSGLAFSEDYADLAADATAMLFRSPSAGAFAAARPLAVPPDSLWHYSSGTTNILSRIVRDQFHNDLRAYWEFPRRALFTPIGAHSPLFEPDPAGTFVGSSFLYATARDWARLGQLYLDDGFANGHRILPPGWVKYTTTPTPKAPRGCYGAQIWLNAGDPANPSLRNWPHLPPDTFSFNGHEGQYVIVIPSRHAVIVRLGLTQGNREWDPGTALPPILQALPR
jgi:CubicO group peptidase (beta-lactamase class C family)